MKKIFTSLALFCSVLSFGQNAPVIYVKQGAAGNGSSWSDAFSELADALKYAHEHKAKYSKEQPLQIWVAKGTYQPLYSATDGDNFSNAEEKAKQRAFLMVKNVQLYGGFQGSETALTQRNYAQNPTILSGDLNNDDTATGSGKDFRLESTYENTYHVVISVGDAENARLDGFTIKGGSAIETGNRGEKVGGVEVKHNNGGGIYNALRSNLKVMNCIIKHNEAKQGGGIWNDESESIIHNTLIVKNYAQTAGGGVYNYAKQKSFFKPTFVNVSIVANHASQSGGMHSRAVEIAMQNSILLGNTSNHPSRIEINDDDWNSPNTGFQINYEHCIAPLAQGAGNTDAQSISIGELFTDPTAEDFTPKKYSPAKDKGSDAHFKKHQNDFYFDAIGKPRFNQAIDIGAIENQEKEIDATHNRLYVMEGKNGAGSSWGDELGSLGEALKYAHQNPKGWNEQNPLEIWVAKGTYQPSYGTDFTDKGKENTFIVPGYVKLYGGFVGGESSPEERKLSIGENLSVISGDLQNNDIASNSGIAHNADNTKSLIKTLDGAFISGFLVKGANADTAQSAAMVSEGKLHLSQVHFLHNSGTSTAALLTQTADISLKNVTFQQNFSPKNIISLHESTAHLEEMSFLENTAGISTTSGKVSILNSQIKNNPTNTQLLDGENTHWSIEKTDIRRNAATEIIRSNGGKLHIVLGKITQNTASNSIIQTQNTAVEFLQLLLQENKGKSIHATAGRIHMINTAVVANTDGIHSQDAELGFTNCTIASNAAFGVKTNRQWEAQNSIVLGNGQNQWEKASIRYSLVQGLYDEENGNISSENTQVNDLFVSNTDFSLKDLSKVINKGNKELLPPHIDTDIAGNNRFIAQVDMGAYENETSVLPTNGVLYVKKNSTGDGSSWESALGEVADALRFAQLNAHLWEKEPLQIWVSEGTYTPLYSPEDGKNFTPNPTNMADRAFLMVKNVQLYGGFQGNEKTLQERNTAQHHTILSGDFLQNDDNNDDSTQEENAYHTLIFAGEQGSAAVEDVIIEHGYGAKEISSIVVNGQQVPRNNGGGIIIIEASPKLNNLTIRNNTGYFGGGIYAEKSSAQVQKLHIHHNIARAYGGAMASKASKIQLSESKITHNHADYGAGMYNLESEVRVQHSLLTNNQALNNGGAIHNADATLHLLNSALIENQAKRGGAVSNFYHKSQTLMTNVTATKNKAQEGAGIYNYQSQCVLQNSIIIGNTHTDASTEIVDTNGANTTTQHSVVEGNAQELFVNFDQNLFSPRINSPAFNTAKEPLYLGANGTYQDHDMAQKPRFVEKLDIGAYENQCKSELAVPQIVISPRTCKVGASASIKNFDSTLQYSISPSEGVRISTTGIEGAKYDVEYTLIVQNQDGCQSKPLTFTLQDKINAMDVLAMPQIVISPETCKVGASASIKNFNPTLQYSISPSEGVRISTTGIEGAKYNVEYTLIVQNQDGCQSKPLTFTLQDKINAPEKVKISTESAVKISNFNPNYTYQISPSQGVSISPDGQITGISPDTDYVVTAKNAHGCEGESSDVLRVSSPQAPIIGLKRATCSSNSIATITNFDPEVQYSIVPENGIKIVNGTLQNAPIGNYTIVAKNKGYTSESTHFAIESQVQKPEKVSIEIGEKYIRIRNLDPKLGYRFENGQPVEVSADGYVQHISPYTYYRIIAVTEQGCKSDPSQEFALRDKLQAIPDELWATEGITPSVLLNDLLNDEPIPLTGVKVELTDRGNATHHITFNSDGTFSLPKDTKAGIYEMTYAIFHPQHPEHYSTAKVKLVVAPIINIYNAISVNNDGKNELFYIENIEAYPQNKLQIFNQMGQKVYEAHGYNNKDVSYKGQLNQGIRIIDNGFVKSDTYFYLLQYTNHQGIEEQKVGYLQVAR